MFAAFVNIFTMKLSVARGKPYLPIGSVLSVGYPYGNAIAGEKPDRGGLRCQVWSEKVTRMLQSLLTRYESEGDKMLENTGVWVCTACGKLNVNFQKFQT